MIYESKSQKEVQVGDFVSLGTFEVLKVDTDEDGCKRVELKSFGSLRLDEMENVYRKVSNDSSLDKIMKSLETILWSNKFSSLNIEFNPSDGFIKVNISANNEQKQIVTGKAYR